LRKPFPRASYPLPFPNPGSSWQIQIHIPNRGFLFVEAGHAVLSPSRGFFKSPHSWTPLCFSHFSINVITPAVEIDTRTTLWSLSVPLTLRHFPPPALGTPPIDASLASQIPFFSLMFRFFLQFVGLRRTLFSRQLSI